MTLLQNSDESSLRPGQSLPGVGERFDKYTLLARLAQGGMAELFVARLSGAAGFRKTVVIKRILPHVAHDENFTQMFLDEALTCAQLTHPNICQVFELCEAYGSHFLVLEHLEGATVGDLIRRCIAADQQLNMRLAAGIIIQACDGLHAAHEQVDEAGKNTGLVHRDVSPANLFVTVHGIVKVLDFGIAKAGWMSRKTRTGTLLGKCEYMSPEQARGGVPVDRRSDIFSLGITAWELLCGRRLFRRETEYDTLKAVLRAPIESPRSLRPTIPEALDQAIMCALERDREDRFHTAYDFRKAIASALRPQGGPTPMCDIAPVIRNSFAEELKIQRAAMREASAIKLDQGVAKAEQLPTPTPPKVESDKTQVNKSRQLAQEAKEERKEPDLIDSSSDSDRFDNSELETEIHQASPPKRGSVRKGDAIAAAQPIAALPEPGRATPEKVPGASIAVVLVVILLSACVTAAATYVVVTLIKNNNSDKAATSPPTSSVTPNTTKPAPDLRPQALVTSLDQPKGSTDTESGTLSISSTMSAKIYLHPDGKFLGTTPIPELSLPIGAHKLKAESEDGRIRYFQVDIVAGENAKTPLQW